ncbi:MAG: DUF2442 domain-containing protein [Solirubrobacterales bacterium]
MTEIIHPTEVRVVGDHRLWLRFEDGAAGEIDFAGRSWRGIFSPLSDPEFFRRVELDPEVRTIVWPNGADIAPETLHSWVIDGVENVSV